MATKALFALVCALVVSGSAYADRQILIDATPLSPASAEKAAAVAENPAVKSVASVDLTLSAASVDTQLLTIFTAAGELTLARTESRIAENGLLVWRGQLIGTESGRSQGSGLFVFGPEAAAGTIVAGGREWRLAPQGAGKHLLLEVDTALIASAGGDDVIVPRRDELAEKRAAAPDRPESIAADKAITTVDVLIAVDAKLIASYPAARATAQVQIESANRAFADSLTQVQLRLVGTQLLTDVPQTDPAHQLFALASPTDGPMDTVHSMRNGVGADIVVLLSKSSGAVCGVAQSLMPTAAEAFAVVRANSGCGDSTLFAHEVAHLFSADHDPANAAPTSKPYAHGFVRNYLGKLASESYATIMTYNNDQTCISYGQPMLCQRENAFSNPRRLDEYGFPMGTVGTHDNARAIVGEAARIAAFRSPPTNTAPYPNAGSWYNPGRAGNGLSLTRARVTNGGLVLTWYTYLSDGSPIWYSTGVSQVINGLWRSDLYKVRRLASGIQRSIVGSAQIKFFGSTSGEFSWDFHSNGIGTDGAEYVQHLFGGNYFTGQWYNPLESGWGFIMDHQGSQAIATALIFQGTEPVWSQSYAISGSPGVHQTYPMRRYVGIGLCPSCQGQTIQRSNVSAGSMDLTLTDSGGQGSTWIQTADGAWWTRGPVDFVRLTTP
jgi:hypothetical protein